VAFEDGGGVEESVGFHKREVMEDVIAGGDGAVEVIHAVAEKTGRGPCHLHEEGVQAQGLG
jgi:hypothetical protein